MKNMLVGTFIPSIMKDIYFSTGNAVGRIAVFAVTKVIRFFYAFISVTFYPFFD